MVDQVLPLTAVSPLPLLLLLYFTQKVPIIIFLKLAVMKSVLLDAFRTCKGLMGNDCRHVPPQARQLSL